MNDLIIVFCGLLCTYLLSRRFELSHPCTIFVLMWTALGALHGLNLLHLTPTSLLGASTVSVGMLSVTAGTMLSPPRRLESQALSRPSAQPLVICITVLTALLAFGVWQFRQSVSASVGGRDFSALEPSQILFATAYGRAQGGGLGRLCFYLGPLVACLAVFAGSTRNRAWFLLVPAALLATSQTPSRTTTFVLVAVVVPFALYVRRSANASGRTSRSDISSLAKVGIVTLLLGVLVVAYFNSVGTSLGKNQPLNQAFGSSIVPTALRVPLAYATGGLSALSRAQDLGQDPGDPGRSIFAIMRLGEALGAPVRAPEVITHFVGIPIPFNVYTGFGDVWFDFGFLGLFAFFCIVGIVLAVTHRRAMAGSVTAAWFSAMLISVLATSAMTLRLFYLDTVVLFLLGGLIFAFLSRRAPVRDVAGRSRTVKAATSRVATGVDAVGR